MSSYLRDGRMDHIAGDTIINAIGDKEPDISMEMPAYQFVTGR